MSGSVSLPLEIWVKIAMLSKETWFSLCQAIPLLGRYSLDTDDDDVVQRRMHSHFDVPHTLTLHGYYTSWTLDKRWLKAGELHRDDDKPAYVLINVQPLCGWRRIKDTEEHTLEMAWWQDGLLHRDGGKPAFQRWIYDIMLNSTILHEQYWQKGVLLMKQHLFVFEPIVRTKFWDMCHQIGSLGSCGVNDRTCIGDQEID